MTTTTIAADDLRARRESLELNRLDLAIRSGVSPSWIAALEAGLRPARGSAALDRVEASLAELEAADKPSQPLEAA